MSNAIWKFSLGPQSAHTIGVPRGGEFIHADIQKGEFFVWALVPDTETEKENRYILIAPTGGIGDSRLTKEGHISTIMDGAYVWHVFEVKYD